MATSNVALQKADPDNRGSYGIANVNSTRRAGNDNTPRQSITVLTPPPLAANDNIRSSFRHPTVAVKTARLRSFNPLVLWLLAIPYGLQLAFAIIHLMGFTVLAEDTFIISTADALLFGSVTELGGGLFLIGMVGAVIFGVITALGAFVPLKTSGANPNSTGSLLILIVCSWLLLCPVLNLFPIMALWCLYVVFAT